MRTKKLLCSLLLLALAGCAKKPVAHKMPPPAPPTAPALPDQGEPVLEFDPDEPPTVKTSGYFVAYFDFDDAGIKDQAAQLAARALRGDRFARATIVGHACPLGTDAYNLELSRRRAEAVLAVFTQNYGIASSRVDVSWRGEENPIMTDPKKYELNRRVEITIKE